MTTFRQACARLFSMFKRRRLDREFDEELHSHIDLATEVYVQQGFPPLEARRLARLKFGGLDASREAHRDSRGLPWPEGFFYDARFAIRGLARDRAYAITAVLMLALAIGLNASVFVVMNAMLYRGFPSVERNDRLVYIQERDALGRCCIAEPDFEDWRRHAKSFRDMAFVSGLQVAFRDGNSGRFITSGSEISANAFSLLGVKPVLGRDFVAADESPGAAPVAILSYRFWELHLEKRTDVIGHRIRVNQDKPLVTVIGVMPQGFWFPERVSLWMPLDHGPRMQARAPSGFLAVGRLNDGVTIEKARAELETIGRRLANAYPSTNRDLVPHLADYAHFFVGPDAGLIYGSMWAGTWLVLLIACANLANLTLARSIGRTREFSTRLALGAGQWRMMRLILIESLMLAAAGAVLGWSIARWSVNMWAGATESVHQVFDYTFDGGMVAYLAATSVIAVVLFSLIPIVRTLHLDLNLSLKGGARGMTHGVRARSMAGGLVASQMALAIVLLAGAGVLVRSLMRVVDADVGVRTPEKVLAAYLRVPPEKYPTADSLNAIFERLQRSIEAIPGVETEAVADHRPVDNPRTHPFEIEVPFTGVTRPTVVTMIAGSNYFRTIGASTLAGREFNDSDRTGAIPVAVVNQRFVDEFFPRGDVLGKRVRLFDGRTPGEWRVIVGVVGNILQADVTREHFRPLVYVPFRQMPAAGAWFFVRTRGRADDSAHAVMDEARKLDPDVDIEDASSLKTSFAFQSDRMDLGHQDMGKNAALAPIFAVVALLLAGIGLYAVVAHSMGQRTKEIGIRMAVGAAAHEILRLVLREGMTPVIAGLLCGLAASVGVNRILQSQLVGVSPYDPATLAGAVFVLVAIALFGCAIPARRATRVEPAAVLRQD